MRQRIASGEKSLWFGLFERYKLRFEFTAAEDIWHKLISRSKIDKMANIENKMALLILVPKWR